VHVVDVLVARGGGGPGGAGADDHRRHHQPRAVRGRHQERPPAELAPVHLQLRPAEVRVRAHEAEDPEGDQRDAGAEVQGLRVAQQAEADDDYGDQDDRELVADSDRHQRA
jgi:hypothetical protein